MPQFQGLSDTIKSYAEYVLAFVYAELRYVRWLLSEAAAKTRKEGPVPVLRSIPGAVVVLARSVRTNASAIGSDATDARNTWEGKGGRYSPAFYAMIGPNETSERVRDAIARRTSTDASVLEIGCSSGRHLACLHEHGYRDLYGVEINQDAIDVMEKAYPELAADATVYQAPIQDIVEEFETDQFDVVYTVETLELIPPEDEWVFNELRRVAGELLITVENEGDDTPGPTITVVEDFPLYLRDWSETFADEGWEVVQTNELEIDTLRVFRNEPPEGTESG